MELTNTHLLSTTKAIVSCYDVSLTRFRYFLKDCPFVQNIEKTLWEGNRNSRIYFIFITITDAKQIIDYIYSHFSCARSLRALYFYDHAITDIKELGNVKLYEGKTLRMQTHPKELVKILEKEIPLEVNLHPTKYSHVLYVVYMSKEKQYYFAITPKELQNSVSPATSNVDGALNRAFYKIEEALWSFSPSVKESMKDWKVLDIGASPGGWTSFLSKICKHVVAVDPGELHLSLQNDPKITHLKKKLQDSFEELVQLAPFDMIVCDMNDHPEHVGKYIKETWKLLKANSKIVITLKLKINDNLNKTHEECKKMEEQLSDLYYDIKIQWLFANSAHERTLIASSKDLNVNSVIK